MARRARSPTTSTPPPAQRPALWAAGGGALLGLTLARLLFDLAPWRFEPLSTLPGALSLAALGAVAAFAPVRLARTPPNPVWSAAAMKSRWARRSTNGRSAQPMFR